MVGVWGELVLGILVMVVLMMMMMMGNATESVVETTRVLFHKIDLIDEIDLAGACI